MNRKIVLGSLAGATLINAALAACSGPTKANADEAAVQVALESCDKTFQIQVPQFDGGVSNQDVYYAEHAYPGISKEQLAGHVTNWNATTGNPTKDGTPSSYALRQQDAVYVKDGFVGVGCQQGTTTMFIYAP